jgi:hypothetical protein
MMHQQAVVVVSRATNRMTHVPFAMSKYSTHGARVSRRRSPWEARTGVDAGDGLEPPSRGLCDFRSKPTLLGVLKVLTAESSRRLTG